MDKVMRRIRRESGIAHFERTVKKSVYTDPTTKEYKTHRKLVENVKELLLAFTLGAPTRRCFTCGMFRLEERFNQLSLVCSDCAKQKLIYLARAKLHKKSTLTIMSHGTLEDLHEKIDNTLINLLQLNCVKRMPISELRHITEKNGGYYNSIGYWHKKDGLTSRSSVIFKLVVINENTNIAIWR